MSRGCERARAVLDPARGAARGHEWGGGTEGSGGPVISQPVSSVSLDSTIRISRALIPGLGTGPSSLVRLSRAMMIFLLGLAAMCPGPSPKFFSVIRPYRRTARTRVRVVSSSCATRRSRRFALRSSPPPVAAKYRRAKNFFRPHSRPGRGGRRSAVAAAADAKTPPVRRLRPRVKDHSAPFALTSRDHPLSSRRETLATPPSLCCSLHCVHLSGPRTVEKALEPSPRDPSRGRAMLVFPDPGTRTPRGAHARTLGAYLPMPPPTVSVAHRIFLAGFNDD